MATIEVQSKCAPYSGPHVIRAAAVLTTSYVASDILDGVENFRALKLYTDFTKGSLTTVELKIEFSHDGISWYQEPSLSDSSGTITINLAEYQKNANLAIPLTFTNIAAKEIRVSVKGTGTVTGSSCTLTAVLFNSVSFSRF